MVPDYQAEEDASEEGPGMADVPRCPTCNRPTDDIEGMTETQLLAYMREELLKDLNRKLGAGQATHQEMAIMRGFLRDYQASLKKPAPEAGAVDESLPPQRRSALPQRDRRPRPDYEGTDR
jgi:hypothetical protein